MSGEEISGNSLDATVLYHQTCVAAQELTDPKYIRTVKGEAQWKAHAVCLALLFLNLDETLTKGGDIPMEWVIGDLPEDIQEQ
ncbi:hypothetical protein ACWD4G_42030 [Streptomyces sp. NPDC002643]